MREVMKQLRFQLLNNSRSSSLFSFIRPVYRLSLHVLNIPLALSPVTVGVGLT